MGFKVESDRFVERDQIIYDRLDIIIDGDVNIKLISLSEMVDNQG